MFPFLKADIYRQAMAYFRQLQILLRSPLRNVIVMSKVIVADNSFVVFVGSNQHVVVHRFSSEEAARIRRDILLACAATSISGPPVEFHDLTECNSETDYMTQLSAIRAR